MIKLVRKLSQNSQGSTCAEDLFMVKGKVAVQHLTCRFAQLLNQLGPRANIIKKFDPFFMHYFAAIEKMFSRPVRVKKNFRFRP